MDTCNTCKWFYKYVKVCGIDFTMAWKAKPACKDYKPQGGKGK